jgi:SPP1 gp7 family putative phage head morphogenesis protein
MPDPLVIRKLDEWRERLGAEEAAELRRMTRAWLQIENSLQAEIDNLAEYLEGLRQAGETITPARLLQMERYQSLIAQAREEHDRFAQQQARVITEGQRQAVVNGVGMAQDTIEAAGLDGGVRALQFNRLNAEAVNIAVGFAGDGTPLYNLLRTSYPETVIRLTDNLVNGLAMGIGPRATARLMAQAMAGNLDRALTVARTEQIRALRVANLEQMQTSGVVAGYVRRAQRSSNVCPACIALDGTVYRTLEAASFEAHPNCACVAQPVLTFGRTPTFPTGPQWFATLPERQQRAMLGPGRYTLYEQGQLDWQRVATIDDNPTWGKTIKLTPLAELAP